MLYYIVESLMKSKNAEIIQEYIKQGYSRYFMRIKLANIKLSNLIMIAL